ncbi:MAG: translation initiation factor IF-5A [Nanoarchaeota archaeon]
MLRLIDATGAKIGTTIMIEEQPCTVRSNDISKTGKHGASKCRIEAIEIITGKKKVIAVPGHERFEVPMIEKKRAQVLTVSENTASIMDLESYETIDVSFIINLKEQIAPEKQVEYWDIEGKKIIMRVM